MWRRATFTTYVAYGHTMPYTHRQYDTEDYATSPHMCHMWHMATFCHTIYTSDSFVNKIFFLNKKYDQKNTKNEQKIQFPFIGYLQSLSTTIKTYLINKKRLRMRSEKFFLKEMNRQFNSLSYDMFKNFLLLL